MVEDVTASKDKVLDEGPMFKMRAALIAAYAKLEDLIIVAPIDEKCRYVTDFESNDEGVQDAATYGSAIERLDYVTRFAYGYGYEYLCMWGDVLDDMNTRGGVSSLNVLSLGCGYGIDFWSLRGALWLRKELTRKRRLIGVDFSDWSDCSIGFIERYGTEQGSRYRWNRDAAAYLESEEAAADRALESNIIVFPKSLGELEEQTVVRIARRLAEMARKRALYLCICPAHALGDQVLWRDEASIKRRIAIILREVAGDEDLAPVACGERLRSDEHISDLAPSDWNGWLSREDERYLYNKKRQLRLCCPHAEEVPCRYLIDHPADDCGLDRAPINTGKYPCYRVYYIPQQG